MKKFRIFALLSFSILIPASANAAIFSSFEDGLFTGWDTHGNTSIVDSSFGETPTHGSKQALLTNISISAIDPNADFPAPQPGISTESALLVGNLETQLGMTAGTLSSLFSQEIFLDNGDNSWIPSEGSAISRTISATAGDTLSFDWNFLANGVPNTLDNDFFFVYIPELSSTVTELANIADDSLFTDSTPSLGGLFTKETGYQTFSTILPSTQDYTLTLGILDRGSRKDPSGPLLDNFELTPTSLTGGSPTLSVVPEPASLALFGLGSLGLGLIRNRKSKTQS